MFWIITFFIQDVITPFFSGIIVISTKLERLYGRFNRKIIRIPILTKINGDENIQKHFDNNFKIGYTGDINESKDGIITFLEVLSEIKANKNLSFHMWGLNNNSKQGKELIEKLIKLNLIEKVSLNESIKSGLINNIISGFDLLVLPRPKNIQTEYGFSTKLAEYLISGVPVLVTNVSDNKLFIHDEENGFIVDSNNKEIMKRKLEEIMNFEKNQLINIGLEGKKTAERYFDNMKYADILSDFFFSTNTNF